MSERVGVGIIGLGMAGNNHLRSFSACSEARVVSAADPDPAARARAVASVPALQCVPDYRRLLENKDVDLVVVATPHRLHLPVVLEALEAGKDVLCEKPLAVTAAECDKMIAAAHHIGRKLFAVQSLRASAVFRRLKRILQENEMGPPTGARAAYLGCELARMRDATNWKCTYDQAGGGVLLDGGCHVIDLCNWYLGQPVSVIARRYIPPHWPEEKAETTGHMLIDYANGATAQVMASFEARLPGSFTEPTLHTSVELYYQNGSARASNSYLGPLGTRSSLRFVCGQDREQIVEPTKEDQLDYHKHILDCLINGSSPVVTAEEARMAVAVAQAAYESIRTGRSVPVPPADAVV